MPTRQSLSQSEFELSYLEWHQGKEPLMLLHGLADSAWVWASLGDYLADSHHIIAPDLRGHGESSKPETSYSSREIVADLEALMTSLNWKNAHILGHSWGAKIAAIWASNHPERFRSLILVDPFFIGKLPAWLKITFPFLYRVLPFLQGMGPFASYGAAENLAKNLKQYRGWSKLQQKAFQESIEQKSDGTWGSKFTVSARDRIFEDVMKVDGLTRELTIPTLFIKPATGLNRTAWQLKPYRTYLPNLEIREIPGNHWAFLVEPEIFNQTIANFLVEVSRKNTAEL
ncbi:MAG: alpha/beta hydrolase [Xenococcaceae cyanobacterium MO_188.B32]|nr:alpha/beta hydrolase [Xenococcaceae cyanobacterium MO_188.B32]